MNPEPTPSRRRGRPPKIELTTIGEQEPFLAPPKEPAVFIPDASSVAPVSSPQAPTVPSPLPAVTADDVDLRENPVMAEQHAEHHSGSDSKVRGASGGYLPPEAGLAIQPNPVLPEHSPAPVSPPPPVVPPPAVVSGNDWVPIQSNDVVQVNNKENKFYGTLFTVADIRGQRVHGYQLGAGGKHEYITVNEDECWKVGPSKVRSRNGCSSKWNAENK